MTRDFNAFCVGAGATLTLLLCGAATGALAAEAAAPAKDNAVEEVVVTGSRIEGVAPVGSTVIGLSSKDIVKATPSSVSDLLRRVPQVSGFGFDESNKNAQGPGVSGTNGSRAASVNLRGLGPGATLVLFDGQRMAQGGLAGGVQDPSGIPIAALQRVEVVADGASAIYGSDAVAGVVNFIPKTHYTGAETSLRYSVADGQTRRDISQTLGHDWGSGSALLVIEHYDQTAINGSERDWFKSDLRAEGGTDYRNGQCNPGNLTISGVSYAIPAGGVSAATASRLVPNTRNLCDNYKLGDIVPRQRRDQAYFSVFQDVNPDVQLFARGFYSKRIFNVVDIQQGSTQIFIGPVALPRTNAFFVNPPGASTTAAPTLEYFFGPEFGLIKVKGFSRNYQGIGGVNMKLPHDWKSELRVSYSRDDEDLTTFGFVPAELTAALASSNPATALDVFGGGRTTAATLAKIFNQIFEPYARSIVTTGQGNVSGPLFDLPGGTVKLAAGVDYTVFTVGAGSIRGPLNAPTLAFLYTPRVVKSAYAEALVPIVGAGNEMPGVKALDLSLAYRYDDYSDVGSTKNPKIGVNYSPFDGLLLKASYGTSFKAPSVTNNRSPRAGSALIVTTANDPGAGNASVTGLSINDGNPGLRPETAKTYSVAAEYNPPQVPGLALSATWFSVKYKDQINGIPTVAQALSNPIYASLVIRNPTPAQIAATGLTIQGAAPAVPAFLVDSRPNNLGGTDLAGVDFVGTYDFSTGWGDFTAGAVGSYMYKYDVKATPTATAVSQLNKINFPLKFRARGFVDWSKGPWSAGATLNYNGKYDNNIPAVVQKVDAFITLDARVSYAVDGEGWLGGTTLTVQAENLLDEDPPFVNILGGFDPGAASAVGRLVSVTLTKKW